MWAQALAGLTLACGPTRLDLAQDHWRAHLAAQARGEAEAAAQARAAAVTEAKASLAAEESRSGQAALVLALALRRGETAEDAGELTWRREALRQTRGANLPAHLRLTRLAAHCAYAADRDLAHYAGLCWSALLAALPTAAQYGPGELEAVRGRPSTAQAPVGYGRLGHGHRAAAAEGLGNANAARLPGWLTVVALGDRNALWATLHRATLADPLDPDLLTVLSARFEALCRLPDLTAEQVGGLREAQADLLDAALDLDDFDAHDRRCAAVAARRAAHEHPLCPSQFPTQSIPAPLARPLGGPSCPRDTQ